MAVKQSNEPGLMEVIQQFCVDKSLDRDSVMDVIKESLLTAFKKRADIPEDIADDKLDVEFSGERVVLVIPKVVVELNEKESPVEISLEEARKIDASAEIGNTIVVKEKPVDLSRIISNQAKQMVYQRLRDMEKELLYNEYKDKEGELTHGYFQRWKRDAMSIDLGKIEGVMPKREQNPGERYRQGDRLKAIIARVELKPKEPIPVITLSRASGEFVQKLFEMEIPEIYEGDVEILNVVRIPSIRTKVVVNAVKDDIDPVGACVGMKGVRIQSIVRELGNERIDIVAWSPDDSEFIKNAISPAKPLEVKIDSAGKEALVIVPDESLSLAIGINGSNVKLASQLTKYKIDIRTLSQYNEDMTSPEAREKLDQLFNKEEENDGKTPLEEIPGLTPRIIGILQGAGINDVETLIEMSQDELSEVSGLGHSTADQIMKLLAESVEWVED